MSRISKDKIKASIGLGFPIVTSLSSRISSLRKAVGDTFAIVTLPTISEVNEWMLLFPKINDKLACAYCGKIQATELDHFRPIINNGYPTGHHTTLLNLVPSCSKCNQSKRNKDWEQIELEFQQKTLLKNFEDWSNQRGYAARIFSDQENSKIKEFLDLVDEFKGKVDALKNKNKTM